MTRPLLALALVGVLFAGCDGTETEPEIEDAVCGTTGFSSQGSFSATVDGAAFQANCFDVQIRTITVPNGTADVLTITGFDYALDDPSGEYVGLVTGEPAAGVFTVEERATTTTAAEAEYVVDGDAVVADRGTVTITQYTTSRVAGSFDVESDDGGGTAFTGQFDISY